MTVLEADGRQAQDFLLLFALDCFMLDDVRRNLWQRGYPPKTIQLWLALLMRAHQGVPARLPSDAEPRGYEGREKEPLPPFPHPNSLDRILYALVKDKDTRRLIAKHLEKKRGLAHGRVLAEMNEWRELYEERLAAAEVSTDPLGDAAAARAQEQSQKLIVER